MLKLFLDLGNAGLDVDCRRNICCFGSVIVDQRRVVVRF